MIGLQGLRPIRLAFVAVLLMGGAAAGSPEEVRQAITCISLRSRGDLVSLSCGDPRVEAWMRAQAMTPEQARAVECEPIRWRDGSQSAPEPEMLLSDGSAPTPSPRTPDAAVAARVNQAWDRVERWLGAHASATLRELGDPASPEDLARWEESHGRRLPDDLYASYLRHDGAGGNLGAGFRLPPSHGLMGLADIDSVSDGKCQEAVMRGPAGGRRWNGAFLPFAESGEGSGLFVDPRTGRVGQSAWNEDFTFDGPMGWQSYATLLEALAGSLEAGTALRDWYPAVTAGCELRWADEPAASLPGGCAGAPRPSPTPAPIPEPTAEPAPRKLTPEQARATGCRPARRPAVFRVPAREVASRVGAAWRRIERLLARKAPATYRALRAPAAPTAIAKAEAAMGLRFPDDLRASLLRHDGAKPGGFGPAPFYEFMSVKSAYADWKMLCGIMLKGPEEVYGGSWDGHLIPFASAIDGGNLFIDTRTGKTGEYFSEEGLSLQGDVAWPSYLALLVATAESLRTGRPIRGWRPTIEKGVLDWEEAGAPDHS